MFKQNLLRSLFVCAVLTVQIGLSSCYVRGVPMWMPSDERAHMLSVNDLMNSGQLHVIADVSKDTHYESIQPPLYYFCCAKLCDATSPDGTNELKGLILRYAGLALFVFSAALLFFIFRAAEIYTFCGVPTLFAFSPIMAAIYTTVTNDSLAFCLSIILFAWLNVRRTEGWLFHSIVGALSGALLLTKLTTIPVLVAVYALVWVQSAKSTITARLIGLVIAGIVALSIFCPWLIWNYQNYHAFTAYSKGAQTLVHGGLRLTDVSSIKTFLSSFAAYHFIPSEFWLNQFQVPGVVRAAVVILLLTTFLVGGVALITRRECTENKVLYKSEVLYLFCILFWLAVSICISVEPVRGFLICYFGFCSMQISAARQLGRKIQKKAWTVFCVSIPITFSLALHLYLLEKIVPHLQGFGLKPI